MEKTLRYRLPVSLAAISAASALICLLSPPSFAQDRGGADQNPGLNGGRLSGTGRGRGENRPPARPTPHWPDGRVNLGPRHGEKGVWEGNAGATLATNTRPGLDNASMNLPTNMKISDVPFLPW